MKSILKLVLLAGPLVAFPTEAFAWGSCGPAGCSSCGWHLCSLNPFNIHGCLAGPWYSYWPYEAHFSAGAPVGCNYPYWPGAAGAVAYPGAMSAFPPPMGAMGQFGSYGGNMGYPADAGFSYSQTPSWPTSTTPPNGFPVTGTPMQGSNYWPGQ